MIRDYAALRRFAAYCRGVFLVSAGVAIDHLSRRQEDPSITIIADRLMRQNNRRMSAEIEKACPHMGGRSKRRALSERRCYSANGVAHTDPLTS